MPRLHPAPPAHAKLPRRGAQVLAALRDLEENRLHGLVAEEDYARQRAGKMRRLLRPAPGMWLAALLGAPLLSAPFAALVWHYARDERLTFAIAILAAALGVIFPGRMLEEKFTHFCSRGRRKTLIALLDEDLLTATEFSDCDERLAKGKSDFA